SALPLCGAITTITATPKFAVLCLALARNPYRLQAGQCLLLAQSGHHGRADQCPFLGVKRTLCGRAAISAFDPKRTSATVILLSAFNLAPPCITWMFWMGFPF